MIWVSVTVLAIPDESKVTNAKVAEFLKKVTFEGLFLGLPQQSQESVSQICEGLPFDYSLSELRKLLESVNLPIDSSWEERMTPLLKVLPHIKEANQGMEIYCYGDMSSIQIQFRLLTELTLLTLRQSISKQTVSQQLKQWLDLLKKCRQSRMEALERETDFIVLKAGNHDESICVSPEGGFLERQIAQEGFKTRLIPLNPPSTFNRNPLTPIEMLSQKINQGANIPIEELQKLVRLQAEYVSKQGKKPCQALPYGF